MADPSKLKGEARNRYFQGHYNFIGPASHIPFHVARLEVDGRKGPRTDEAIRDLKSSFGIKNPTAALTDEFMEMVRSPFKGRLFRRPGQWARGLRWRTARRRAHAAWARKQKRNGSGAVRAAERMVGKVEIGYNDAPWLRQMQRDLVKAGAGLGWMIPGQPYCGFGCDWSWLTGMGALLPDGVVYTPNICPWSGRTIGKLRFTRVDPNQAKPGALVVMNFGSGGAKHVALARGPMKGGVIPTVEFNTSPSNAGSQGNGGGVWKRTRSRGLILCTVNVEKVA